MQAQKEVPRTGKRGQAGAGRSCSSPSPGGQARHRLIVLRGLKVTPAAKAEAKLNERMDLTGRLSILGPALEQLLVTRSCRLNRLTGPAVEPVLPRNGRGRPSRRVR